MTADLMSAADIIKRFKVPRSTLYYLVRLGKLHPQKRKPHPWYQHDQYLFDPDEVARVLGEPPQEP